MEKATELEYLRWFYEKTDYGPSEVEADIREVLNQQFKEETGKELPEGYGEEE